MCPVQGKMDGLGRGLENFHSGPFFAAQAVDHTLFSTSSSRRECKTSPAALSLSVEAEPVSQQLFQMFAATPVDVSILEQGKARTGLLWDTCAMSQGAGDQGGKELTSCGSACEGGHASGNLGLLP